MEFSYDTQAHPHPYIESMDVHTNALTHSHPYSVIIPYADTHSTISIRTHTEHTHSPSGELTYILIEVGDNAHNP